MSNIKIRLSVTLPGSVLYSQEETCKLQIRTVKNASGNPFDQFEMRIMDKGKPETLKVFVRKSKPATQVISLSEEAYDYFTDPMAVPYKFKGVWKGLTPNQRVQWHCQQIAEAMGGKLDSFVVLD